MPIIKRVTFDMFEFADSVDYQVNPINLEAVPSIGLSLEFRRRVPDELYFSKYREACRSKELRIGTVQVLEDTNQSWGMINFPTKRYATDKSEQDDIARGLEALRTLLQQDRYRYASIGIPMLGVGMGAQDYEIVYPMMMEHLGNLDATVFLSMSPDRTPMRPKYLTIAGPLDYGLDDTSKASIDWSIAKVLEKWDAKLDNYEGVVSGGYPGVDAYVCGSHYGELFDKKAGDVAYNDTYVWRQTEKMPLVVKPNTQRNGVGANLQLGNLLCEISEDIILFKPKGHNNNRLSAMQTWLQADKEKHEREGLFPRRVAIFGDVGIIRTPEDVIVQDLNMSDMPY